MDATRMRGRRARRGRWLGALALAAAGPAAAQGIKLNLPLPSDPGLGGGDVVGILASPDGAWLAYVATQETVGVFELFVVALDGSRISHKLNPPLVEHGFVGAFRFSPDSQHVVFAADAVTEDVVELYSAPVDGSSPAVRLHGTPVEGGDAGDASLFVEPFLISAVGQRVVFPADLEVNGRYELYSAPLDGSAPAVRLSGPLLADRDVTALLSLTLDGTRAVYLSDELADDRQDIWVVPIDGSSPPLRLSNPSGSGMGVVAEGHPGARLTPDGLRVVYRADARIPGLFELFRAPLDGSAAPEPLIQQPAAFADVFDFALTPDGLRVVLRADLLSDGRLELWSIATLDTGSPKKLSGEMPAFGNVDGSGTPDGAFRISPDGSRVVYRADPRENERLEIFSAPVDGSEAPVRLTPALGPGVSTRGFRMSPDGQWVVYVADQRELFRDELFAVPITGGVVRRLSGTLLATSKVQNDFRVGTERVAFRVDSGVDEQFELFSAPLTGFPPPVRAVDGSLRVAGPTRLTLPLLAETDVDGTLVLLPGDTHVLYLADLASPQQKEAFVSPLDASAEPLLVSAVLTDGPPTGDVHRFGFAGARAWYSATQDDPRAGELYAVELDDPDARVKLHDHALSGGQVQHPRSTPDGQAVVYRCDPDVRQRYDLFQVLADGSAPPQRVSTPSSVSGAAVEENFVLTNDGSRAVYRGNLDVGSIDELYSASLDGSEPQVKLNVPLVPERDVESDVRVSPDGEWVVYRADQDTLDQLEIYGAPSDGSAPAVKLNGSLIADGDVAEISVPTPNDVRISPDSAHVVFAADAAIDGALEVFSAPIDGSAPAVRLHAPLGAGRIAFPAALTPDGTGVLFISDVALNDHFELFAVPIDGSQAPLRVSQAFPFAPGVLRAHVSLDGTRAVYVAAQNGERLFSAPLDGSQLPLEIGASPFVPSDQIESLFLAPDGQRVVYVVTGTPDRMYTAWVDGSEVPVLLAELDSFTGELAFTAGDDVVYRAVSAFIPKELFRVPLLGGSPPERLHPALPFGRDVTGFALDGTGTRVLYRVDLEADERYELYLVNL